MLVCRVGVCGILKSVGKVLVGDKGMFRDAGMMELEEY